MLRRLVGEGLDKSNLLIGKGADLKMINIITRRGFAVVATEVKALANQTSGATDDVSQRIAQIQETTRACNDGIQRVAASIQDMETITGKISQSVTEQRTGASGIAQRSRDAVAMHDAILANSGAIREAIATMSTQITQLTSHSSALAEHSQRLQRYSEEFMQAAKA
jgi:methyl-accepting chemotaxis protein